MALTALGNEAGTPSVPERPRPHRQLPRPADPGGGRRPGEDLVVQTPYTPRDSRHLRSGGPSGGHAGPPAVSEATFSQV